MLVFRRLSVTLHRGTGQKGRLNRTDKLFAGISTVSASAKPYFSAACATALEIAHAKGGIALLQPPIEDFVGRCGVRAVARERAIKEEDAARPNNRAAPRSNPSVASQGAMWIMLIATTASNVPFDTPIVSADIDCERRRDIRQILVHNPVGDAGARLPAPDRSAATVTPGIARATNTACSPAPDAISSTRASLASTRSSTARMGPRLRAVDSENRRLSMRRPRSRRCAGPTSCF